MIRYEQLLLPFSWGDSIWLRSGLNRPGTGASDWPVWEVWLHYSLSDWFKPCVTRGEISGLSQWFSKFYPNNYKWGVLFLCLPANISTLHANLAFGSKLRAFYLVPLLEQPLVPIHLTPVWSNSWLLCINWLLYLTVNLESELILS